MKKLNELFTDFITNGIFTYLSSYSVPWDNGLVTNLNLAYHGGRSGGKWCAPLVRSQEEHEALSESAKQLIAQTIYSIYGSNWRHLWDTMDLDYNPIENYRMIETMSNDTKVIDYGRTDTRTDNLTDTVNKTNTVTYNVQTQRTDDLTDAVTYGGAETVTHNTTDTRTPNLTTTEHNRINGFNSSSENGVPSDNTTTTATGTDATKKTGTDTTAHSGTDTERHTGTETNVKTGTETATNVGTDTHTGTQANASGGQDTETRNYTLTRSGNIGVTTSQQMIQSERDLWIWNFFNEVVFPDIDKVLTLSVY